MNPYFKRRRNIKRTEGKRRESAQAAAQDQTTAEGSPGFQLVEDDKLNAKFWEGTGQR